MLYRGSCHCGAVAVEVEGQLRSVELCNCSICSKKGYLHWIVPRENVRVVASDDALACYRFNTRVAQHFFCRTCGIAPYYVPRSDPDKIDINARCIEAVDPEELAVKLFDGRNWERSHQASRGRR